MTTNSEEIQTNKILSPETDMQVTENSEVTEQVNMAHLNSESAKEGDIEEGELPEDGEIMDDEDEESQQTESTKVLGI